MKHSFILSCESTADLPYAYMQQREIPVLFYHYSVEGKDYVDDMGRDPAALPAFYQLLDSGKLPSTSQLNAFQYEEFFAPLLEQGDVLHIALGSGMTASVRNAEKAAEALKERFPQRKLLIVDSLCSSVGYGLLVDGAADQRDAACSIEATEQWLLEQRKKVQHRFFSTDLQYFRRSGRISGPAAMLGSVLNLCPLMRLDDSGHIIAYDKARGKKKALEATVHSMVELADGGEQYSGKCLIAHSNCPQEAEQLKEEVQRHFPLIQGDIKICDIGTIIAAHCGPGTVALFFFGKEREAYHHGQ